MNKRGVNALQLSKISGIHQTMISRYLRKDSKGKLPSLETLIALAKALHCTLEELTGIESLKNIETDSKNAYNELPDDLKVLVDEIIKLPEDDYRRKAIEALLLGQKGKE